MYAGITRALLSVLLLVGTGEAMSAQMVPVQHPSGLAFSRPADWTMREGDDGLYFFPPGTAATGSTPPEYMFMGMAPAPEVRSASDPAVVGYFQQLLASAVPGSRRDGNIRSMKTGVGQAAIIPFTGRPNGIDSAILVYVVVRDEEGLYLIHVRNKDARSDPKLGRAIFASLNLKLQIDPALTGAWTRTERSSSTVGSVDPSMFSNTRYIRYEFDGAGNVKLTQSVTDASVSDDVSVIDSGGSVLRGRYSSLGKELYIEWEGGSEASWEYSVFPDYNDGHLILKLKDMDSGKEKFYNRAR